jgi:purine/pyrimidine-nucleoside phosphorylase
MSEFKNVSVVKNANIYFDGKVTSRSVKFDDGSIKTLGIMLPGEYEFGTAEAEIMEILSGDLDVKLPNEDSFKKVVGGENFHVIENSKFQLKVNVITDYCCSYIK